MADPSGRRSARERALHLLYEAEIRRLPVAEVMAEQVLDVDPLTDQLVRGVEAEQSSFDVHLNRVANQWPVERMSALDRAVLRMGVYELARRPDTPTAVILNEATELAKRYGATDEAGRFANGVLARLASELRGS